MTEGGYDVETIVRSNGWFEIRRTDTATQWIATDAPAEVRR